MKTPHRVAIIGSDLAGIATAFLLTRQGYEVILVPAPDSSQGAGSTHTIAQYDLTPDGLLTPASQQHAVYPEASVFFGADRATLDLLQQLGTASLIDLPLDLRLQWARSDDTRIAIPRPRGSQSIRAAAFLRFSGLPRGDRWRLLTWFDQEANESTAPPAMSDLAPAESWLAQTGQSPTSLSTLWYAACRFFHGAPPAGISARTFRTALGRTVFAPHEDTRLGLTASSLEALLIAPALAHLAASPLTTRSPSPVEQVRGQDGLVTGLTLADGATLTADAYVFALPPHHITRLLPDRVLTRSSYFQHLSQLTWLNRVLIHCRLHDHPVTPRILLLEDERVASLLVHPVRHHHPQEPPTHTVSLIATDHAPLDGIADTEWAAISRRLIHTKLSPSAATAIQSITIIREPYAHVHLAPGSHHLRPLAHSPLPNLFLVGDWTDTDLSPGLESAILSARLCSTALTTQLTPS